MLDSYYYYTLLFLQATYPKNINLNTLIRYIYIYNVSSSFIFGEDHNENQISNYIFDREMLLVNKSIINEVYDLMFSQGFISYEDQNIQPQSNLCNHVKSLLDQSEKVASDYNKIKLFYDILSCYSDDTILSVFFREPNIERADKRNESNVDLSSNRLVELLMQYQSIVNSRSEKKADSTDIFINWVKFVFNKYMEGKNNE